MKLPVFCLLLALLFPVVGLAQGVSESRQMVLVLTPDWNHRTGELYFFEKVDGQWQKRDLQFPITVGERGLGWGVGLHAATPDGPQKQEGDRRAPAGIFYLSRTLGYAESAEGFSLPYQAITADTYCVEDSESPLYNQIITQVTQSPPWKSAERLRRKDALYKWLLVVEHNANSPQAGRGSCIFMHVGRNPLAGSVGCTTMQEDHLLQLIRQLKVEAKPVLVQLPRPVYESLQKTWQLPPLP